MHAGEDSHPAPSEKHRNIPSLDGLRAVSIVSVILAHSAWFLPPAISNSIGFQTAIGNGRNGVAVFFIISGFLITNLLLRELDKTGGISLRRFYFRRSMRIFPAFYLYLLVVGLLLLRHILPPMNLKSFLAAATYTWCYYPGAQGFFVTHTWSLSIEEQFYLFWPALLVVLHRRGWMISGCLAFIVGVPLVRAALYFLAPSLRGHEYYMIHGWLDVMMVGCLLALLNHGSVAFQQWKRRYLNGFTATLLAVMAFLAGPYLLLRLPKPWSGIYWLLVHPSATALCIAGVLMYLVDRPQSPAGRFMNYAPVRQLGVISYSLYLWQQLFLSEHLHLLPWGWLLLLGVSAASFWLIEQPFLRLRTWFESRRKPDVSLPLLVPSRSASE
jgi:peptidoglycan/LPS O-acetylase OafA/YrhL